MSTSAKATRRQKSASLRLVAAMCNTVSPKKRSERCDMQRRELCSATQRGLGPKTGRRFNAGASRTAPKEELTKTPRPRPAGGETESLGVGRSCSRLNRRREKPGSPRGVWPLSCGEDELRRGTSAAASSSRFAARRRRGFAGASVPSRHRARAYPLEMHITKVTSTPRPPSPTCRTFCSTYSCAGV